MAQAPKMPRRDFALSHLTVGDECFHRGATPPHLDLRLVASPHVVAQARRRTGSRTSESRFARFRSAPPAAILVSTAAPELGDTTDGDVQSIEPIRAIGTLVGLHERQAPRGPDRPMLPALTTLTTAAAYVGGAAGVALSILLALHAYAHWTIRNIDRIEPVPPGARTNGEPGAGPITGQRARDMPTNAKLLYLSGLLAVALVAMSLGGGGSTPTRWALLAVPAVLLAAGGLLARRARTPAPVRLESPRPRR